MHAPDHHVRVWSHLSQVLCIQYLGLNVSHILNLEHPILASLISLLLLVPIVKNETKLWPIWNNIALYSLLKLSSTARARYATSVRLLESLRNCQKISAKAPQMRTVGRVRLRSEIFILQTISTTPDELYFTAQWMSSYSKDPTRPFLRHSKLHFLHFWAHFNLAL